MLLSLVDEVRRLSRCRSIVRSKSTRHVVGACLMTMDVCAFALAAWLFRISAPEPTFSVSYAFAGGPHVQRVDIFWFLALLFAVVRACSGDYGRRVPFYDGVKGILVTLLVICLPDVIATVNGHHRFSLAGTAGTWAFLLFVMPSMREGARYGANRMGLSQRKTALIGTGSAAESAYLALSHSLSTGFDFECLVVRDGHSTPVPPALSRLRRIVSDSPEEIAHLVRAAGCSHAIVAYGDRQDRGATELVRRLSEVNVEAAMASALGGIPLGNATANVLFGRNVLLLQTRDNLRRWPQRVFKRVFDIVGAAFGLVLLSPLFLILSVLIKTRDGGSSYYSQIRIGRDGDPFPCVKFRTMAPNSDEILERWRLENPELYEAYLRCHKLRDDPRITPIGKWLRRTSLDELPQLVNILRGDMSFVGPRPVVERELLEFYGAAAELYTRVRPGLTGLWQISGRSETTYAERVALDEWYIVNWSFWYDIIIFALTFRVVATGRGAF
jgi:Undecaprenyl-phosphate galactose phosphotransferase WbaP